MTKTDLINWAAKHSPPLTAKCAVAKDGSGSIVSAVGTQGTKEGYKTDYNRLNAVANATEARAALQSRSPPLSQTDVEAAMAEYNK